MAFNNILSFDSHIKQTSRSAFFLHLCNIAKIRYHLFQNDKEHFFHAFVTSSLDYCNSLLSGCTTKSLKTLQLIQNAAARVLTGTRKRDHFFFSKLSALASSEIQNTLLSSPPPLHHFKRSGTFVS